MKTHSSHPLSLVALLLTLSGCGGGSTTAGIEGSGFDGPVVAAITSSGAVTQLGSIFVNGVEYDLSTAVITIDGSPAAEADLDVGSIVIVEGRLDSNGTTGVAERVTAGIALAGPIARIDAALSRFTLLGQTVEIDPATVIENRIDGLAFGGLSVGDDVEVTGFADSTGVWTARRIAPRDAGTPLQITGHVADLDSTNQTFAVAEQIVDYGSATLVGFGSQELAGAPVRVTGDELDPSGALIASEVAFRDPALPGDVGDLAALQGWVTRFASTADFDVDGHAVVTTPSTFIGGLEGALGAVRLDAFVNVKGKLIAGGVVEATEVRQNTLVSLDSVIWGNDGEFVSGDLTDFYGYRCHLEPTTVVTIDGLQDSIDHVAPGDVATIYEHHPNNGTAAHCQIIAVEHNIRGPIESMPTDSASMIVMGQRVWLDTSRSSSRYFGIEGFETLGALNVGDVVEVSGHTTAEGDVLAKSIHAASLNGNYRVIGFAHSVDSALKRFQIGALTVDYAAANVGGFPNDAPAEGDRVLVMSDFSPNAGVLPASIVRYEAGVPRGATGAVVKLNGLITRYVSPDDFDVEGRKTIPSDVEYDPPSTWGMHCDMSKLHADMRFERLVAVGNEAGQPPVYFRPICMFGRRLDERGFDSSALADPSRLSVAGPVQSVDLANRSMRVGGVNLMLLPSTLLTRIDLPPPGSEENPTTTPVFLEDLAVGDRVVARSDGLPNVEGIRPLTFVWLGDGAPLPEAEVSITAQLESATEPDLLLESGISVHVPPTAVFEGEGCWSSYPYEAGEFWTTVVKAISQVTVTGVMNGEEFVPTHVGFPDPVDPDCSD